MNIQVFVCLFIGFLFGSVHEYPKTSSSPSPQVPASVLFFRTARYFYSIGCMRMQAQGILQLYAGKCIKIF